MRLIVICSLAACVVAQSVEVFAQSAPPVAAPATTPARPRSEVIKDVAASEAFFAEYLLSELAGQRGDPASSARDILAMATRLRDARLARRAAEIAFRGREQDLALEATSLWLDIEPDSIDARQALALVSASQGNFAAAKAYHAKRLAVPGRAAESFMLLPTMLTQASITAANPKVDRAKVAAAVRELAAPYPKLPEAHFAVALSVGTTGDQKAALTAIDEALRLNPKFVRAVKLKADLLAETSVDAAAKYLQGYLQSYPDVDELRLNYAQLLISQKSYLSAREELRRADRGNTTNARIPQSIAMLSQQMGDFDDASRQFQRALTLKPADPNAIYFSLALVAEAKKDVAAAMEWYGRVTEGDSFVGAKLKTANLLVKRDGIEAGRKFLREAREAQPLEEDGGGLRTQLVQAEAQLLREAKAFKEAFSVLTAGLETAPDSVEYLYDRAMIAEKLEKFDVLETDLRRVIALKPDYAHAYNALGYTFAERNIRISEANELIQKAIALAPDDASIQDSVGWVQYRMGKLDEAIATLRKAYETRQDAEIAAHLGEVLWTMGKREEAQKVLRAALIDSPGNETLNALLQKYQR